MSTETAQPVESTWRNLLDALAWVAFGLAIIVLAIRLIPRAGQLDDFVQEWTSARNFHNGRPAYEPLESSISRHFGNEWAKRVPMRFNGHPPVAVLWAIPLGMMSYRDAFLVWNLCSLAAMSIAFWLVLGQRGLRMPAVAWAYVGVLVLISSPFRSQLVAGQLNLFLLALITGGWAALRNDRDLTAGVCLGTAAAIKLFPAFLFLYPLVRGRWKVIAAGGVTFFAWHGAAWAILGADALHDYVTIVVPALRKYQDWWMNASILGYFRRLTHVTSGHNVGFVDNAILCYALVGLSVVAVTGLSGYSVYQRRANRDGAELRSLTLSARQDERLTSVDVPFSTCVIANLLVSPITWDHYFLLLILPILVLWAAAERWWQRGLLLTVTVILSLNVSWIWNPLIAGDHELAYLWGGEPSVATAWETVTLLSYPFYTLLGLFVLSLWVRPAEASGSAAP